MYHHTAFRFEPCEAGGWTDVTCTTGRVVGLSRVGPNAAAPQGCQGTTLAQLDQLQSLVWDNWYSGVYCPPSTALAR